MHQVSGNTVLGVVLASITAFLWGILPIALKIVLEQMDPYTITFFRFGVSAIILLVWLKVTKQLPTSRQFSKGSSALLLLAISTLVLNYGAYLIGLDHLEPKTAQVVIQLAPFLLLVGGVMLFKEPFSGYQLLGAIVLFVGLLLFFNQRLIDLFSQFGDYAIGVGLIVFAAVTWAVYALAQKVLLRRFTSYQIMLLIYTGGALCYLPFSDLASLFDLDRWQALALAFCCLNTLIAYGCFAESLNHWHASKVSALLAATPLVTLIAVDISVLIWPQRVEQLDLGWLGLLGALLVVGGSITASLGKKAKA